MNEKQIEALKALRDVVREHDISLVPSESWGDPVIDINIGGEHVDDQWSLGVNTINEILNENEQ